MMKENKFGIWGNIAKKSFWDILPKIIIWARENKLSPHLTKRIFNHPNSKNIDTEVIKSKQDFKKLDFILALGGDGTFLSLARAIGEKNIPILGIHLGDLGFLAKVTVSDLFHRLNQVAKGNFTIEKRLLLKTCISNKGLLCNHFGLNDFVFTNGESHRMLNASVSVDGHFVGNYKADGLIISSPTGSTAYSLSAGGPIVTPKVDSFIITPAAAHTLTSRPLVIPSSSKINIRFSNQNQSIHFVVDGQVNETLDSTQEIEIMKAGHKIGLIDFKDNDYFETLRTKMGWGKRGEKWNLKQ